ncbi:MAG TPA: hypothetical protein VE398_04190 [Acidobacteriota bacterium]|nr:hypothetical protein [Acidobacteriota bacterium]
MSANAHQTESEIAGLTPEFLPMITSVTLSKGAVAMAHKKVIVKHLSTIRNLASLDLL